MRVVELFKQYLGLIRANIVVTCALAFLAFAKVWDEICSTVEQVMGWKLPFLHEVLSAIYSRAPWWAWVIVIQFVLVLFLADRFDKTLKSVTSAELGDRLQKLKSDVDRLDQAYEPRAQRDRRSEQMKAAFKALIELEAVRLSYRDFEARCVGAQQVWETARQSIVQGNQGSLMCREFIRSWPSQMRALDRALDRALWPPLRRQADFASQPAGVEPSQRDVDAAEPLDQDFRVQYLLAARMAASFEFSRAQAQNAYQAAVKGAEERVSQLNLVLGID